MYQTRQLIKENSRSARFNWSRTPQLPPPQSYAAIDIDEVLYLSPPDWDEVTISWNDQRRYREGDVSVDPQSGLLYLREIYADGTKSVVHIWKIQ